MGDRNKSKLTSGDEPIVDQIPNNESDEDLLTENYQELQYQSLPEAVESSLEDAIAKAPVKLLRQIVKEMVEQSSEAHDLATEKLLAPIDAPSKSKDKAKRKRQAYRKMYERCSQCSVYFKCTDNKMGSCVYHPGKKATLLILLSHQC